MSDKRFTIYALALSPCHHPPLPPHVLCTLSTAPLSLRQVALRCKFVACLRHIYCAIIITIYCTQLLPLTASLNVAPMCCKLQVAAKRISISIWHVDYLPVDIALGIVHYSCSSQHRERLYSYSKQWFPIVRVYMVCDPVCVCVCAGDTVRIQLSCAFTSV